MSAANPNRADRKRLAEAKAEEIEAEESALPRWTRNPELLSLVLQDAQRTLAALAAMRIAEIELVDDL